MNSADYSTNPVPVDIIRTAIDRITIRIQPDLKPCHYMDLELVKTITSTVIR